MLFNIISTAFTVYSFALIIYILMSWFPGARQSAFGEMLGRICEPYLDVFRRFIPPLGMIDLSPLVALIVLNLARSGVATIYFMIF
ncbi:YggT family protein [Terribacillus sp. DMT04]|uniref:YggT family protein n=1 Tax=Terribacillus sp. DMT04 TaxID=2850441 RepID=UPI001C2B973D|nr:YggT family protein [Terribacillus sp. DMT04]QXE03022.1 YggT family protein [Terribacillus sp. DMT04]